MSWDASLCPLNSAEVFRSKDPLEIFVDQDCIILRKCQDADIFTGSKEDLIDFEGKKVSRANARRLAELAGFTIMD